MERKRIIKVPRDGSLPQAVRPSQRRGDLAWDLLLAEEQARMTAEELANLLKGPAAPITRLQSRIFDRTNYALKGHLTVIDSHTPGNLKQLIVMSPTSDFNFSIRIGGAVLTQIENSYTDFTGVSDHSQNIVAFYDDDALSYVLAVKELSWTRECRITVDAEGVTFSKIFAVYEEEVTE